MSRLLGRHLKAAGRPLEDRRCCLLVCAVSGAQARVWHTGTLGILIVSRGSVARDAVRAVSRDSFS